MAAAEARADVRLHGKHVGVLSFSQRGSTFVYEDDVASPDHQVLGQIFEENPGRRWQARVGVPAWFANLLPEGELRRQVVREMGGGNVGDFTLLVRLGADLPGAVTAHGDVEPEDDTAPQDDSAPAPGAGLRHSLAGVQLKYSVHSERLTFPAKGDGAWWIAKLPDRSLRDVCVNEYLMMTWLSRARFDVPPVQLVPASAVRGIPEGLADPADLVYLIERFDRVPSGRVHVEDFAQVANVEPKFKYAESGATYDSLAAAVLTLLGGDGYDAFVRRLVAMLVAGNTDAHLKNWGLIYPDGRHPRLAPVYDFHSLTVYSRYQFSPLPFALGGETVSTRIGQEHFAALAKAAGAGRERTARLVSDTVDRLRDTWSSGVKDECEARFPPLARHIDDRFGRCEICRPGR